MRKVINTVNAPAPVGPYNQAIKFGDILFISGQIAINPKTNKLIIDNIEAETTQVMNNLIAVLKEAGMNASNILKTSVFVADMNMYSRINTIYAKYFDEETAPARELVEVANLPKFVNVEISAIAAK